MYTRCYNGDRLLHGGCPEYAIVLEAYASTFAPNTCLIVVRLVYM